MAERHLNPGRSALNLPHCQVFSYHFRDFWTLARTCHLVPCVWDSSGSWLGCLRQIARLIKPLRLFPGTVIKLIQVTELNDWGLFHSRQMNPWKPEELWEPEDLRETSQRRRVGASKATLHLEQNDDGNIVTASRIGLMAWTLTEFLFRNVHSKFVNISKKPLRDGNLNRCPPSGFC